jgi:outer membrane protein, protease secretion system
VSVSQSKFDKGFISIFVLLAISSTAYSLDLLQSYRMALKQDAQYLAALADAEANREALPQAAAQFSPNISSSLMRNLNHTASELPGPNGSSVENNYEYTGSSYSLSLRQPIYRRYNNANYEQAKSQTEGAEATLVRSYQDVINRLCVAYFEELMALDHIVLVQSQKEAFVAQLRAAQRSLESGEGTRTDIDDAQARLDMVLTQDLEARNNLSQARRQLEAMINVSVGKLAPLDPNRLDLSPPVPMRVEDWIAIAEEKNADLRAARANVESARQEIEKANSAHYPTFDLVASLSQDISASNTTINQKYLTTTLGVQISIPIYGGGYVTSKQRQAVATLEKFRQQFESMRRDVGLKVNKEFQNITEGILRISALDQAKRSADQAVFSNRQGFAAGTRTQIDILNAEQQRFNVLRDLARARYQYVLSRVRLQSLVGLIGEGDITIINNWLAVTP